MITNFQIIPPSDQLKKYVERMFVIESSGRMPSNDLKLIVPNACAKLVIPFRNGLIGKTSEWYHKSKQDKIIFIGISDIPAEVDYAADGPAGNITVEFSPLGAYRFFNFQWKEVKNHICDYSTISEKLSKELEEQLVNAETLNHKIQLVQQFLIKQFSLTSNDAIFDYCVNQITGSKGRVSIKELEKYTGYSARWLNIKFHEKLGLSPKNLASIIRFQQYYKSLVMNKEQFFMQKEFYNYYHDQAHFIKDFKRFTGYPPVFLSKSDNDYDKVFYRE